MTNPTPTTLTVLEKDVLQACYNNEYYNPEHANEPPCVWAASVQPNCGTVTLAQMGGVVASLVKKGIVTTQDSGIDAVVIVTAHGNTLLNNAEKGNAY